MTWAGAGVSGEQRGGAAAFSIDCDATAAAALGGQAARTAVAASPGATVRPAGATAVGTAVLGRSRVMRGTMACKPS